MSTHDDTPRLPGLESLPREAEPARDLWPGIEARVTSRPASRPVRRHLNRLRLAAALLLFASGVAVGRFSVSKPSTAAPAVAPGHALAAAEEVQRTGSEYVAAVAALRGEVRAETRNQGREAALSTVFGAAHELARMAPEDLAARQILTTASRARRQGLERTVPF
jgi:hypothetical protein